MVIGVPGDVRCVYREGSAYRQQSALEAPRHGLRGEDEFFFLIGGVNIISSSTYGERFSLGVAIDSGE